MPIADTDIKVYLTGGASNADPNASLGGVISSVQFTDNNLHNLFDKVSSAEASAGDTEYRCLSYKNEHGTITWEQVKAWLSAQAVATLSFGLAAEGKNSAAAAIANESTAPASVTFAAPVSEGAGTSVGDLAASDYYCVWFKRVVSASQASVSADAATLSLKGDYVG